MHICLHVLITGLLLQLVSFCCLIFNSLYRWHLQRQRGDTEPVCCKLQEAVAKLPGMFVKFARNFPSWPLLAYVCARVVCISSHVCHTKPGAPFDIIGTL